MDVIERHRKKIIELGQQAGEYRAAKENAYSVLREAVQNGVAAGISQAEAARLAGVDRGTVRIWLHPYRETKV